MILKNEETPRSKFPFCRVIINYADSKGFACSVLVKTTFGNFQRPVSKICVAVLDQETIE